MLNSPEPARASLPIACDLDPVTLNPRREGELTSLFRSALQHAAIPDGIRLVLPGDRATLLSVSKLIAAERECCRFLRFRMELAPGLGELTLDVDGPPGTAEFLADLGLRDAPSA